MYSEDTCAGFTSFSFARKNWQELPEKVHPIQYKQIDRLLVYDYR